MGVAHSEGDPETGVVADSGIRAAGIGRHDQVVVVVIVSFYSNRNPN